MTTFDLILTLIAYVVLFALAVWARHDHFSSGRTPDAARLIPR